jgi:DNA-binding MarR family transcriptional regulator
MPQSANFAKLQDSFSDLIKNYRDTYRGSMLDELECSDLTFKQFVYLDTILKMNKPTYSEIAKKFNITKPSVTAMVNKMISLGYLERVQATDDRRVYNISRGAKGSNMLDIENNAVTSFAQQITSSLTEAEVTSYIALTKKINALYISKKGN